MTVTTTYTPDTYAGNDATVAFAITSDFQDIGTNIQVRLQNDTTKVITTQVDPTHYSISGTTVTMVTAPATGETLILQLNMSMLQSTDYVKNSDFPETSHEDALDKLTSIAQQIKDTAERAIRIDTATSSFTTELTDPLTADYVVAVNSSGDGFTLKTLVTTGAITVPVTLANGGTGNALVDPGADRIMFWDDGESKSAFLTVGSGLDLTTTTLTGDLLLDTTPQLGGDLDTNTFDIQFDTAKGIRDDSDNEQLIFTKTASAVNYIDLANASTGSGPTLTATGSDTNIDFNLQATGTGVYNFLATSTNPTEIRMYEDTDGGTNYISWDMPTAISTSYSMRLPSSAASAEGQILRADVSSNFTFVDNTMTWVGGNSAAALAAATTHFVGLATSSTTENQVTIVAPKSGQVVNLYVSLSAAPGGSDDYACTLRKNAADQGSTVTISAAATTGNTTGNQFNIAAGDTLDLKVITSATAATAYVSWGITVSDRTG
jgi:hypothetical protein